MFGFNKKKSIQKSKFSCIRDGLTIRGTEYKPKGTNLPTAIICHSFMANQSTVQNYAMALAQAGYASYCFDFCGGSMNAESDGQTTDMSVLTEVKDLEAVMEYAKNLPYTNPHGTTLMGCSQGGLVSALTAAKHESEVSNLILFYPAFCIPDDAKAGKMLGTEFNPEEIPETLSIDSMEVGSRYIEDALSLKPYEQIKAFSGNVLIVHGSKDDVVDPEYSKKAYKEYMAAKKEFNRNNKIANKTIAGGRHGFSGKHDRKAIQLIKEFCATKQKDVKTRKKNPFLSLIKFLFGLVFVLALVAVSWCVFSALNKKDSISLVPSDFSVYVHTDSVWKALSPAIDLPAMEIALSQPEMAKVRGALVEFRQSPLRNNRMFALLASRPVDAAIYLGQGKQDIVAVVDMGVFSAATRLARFVFPFVNVKGLSLIDSGDFYRFEFTTKDSVFYLKPYKNTVIFSTSLEKLEKACQGDNHKYHTQEELSLLNKKTTRPVKIIADSKNVVMSIASQNPTIEKIAALLESNSRALVTMEIANSHIDFQADIPLAKNDAIKANPQTKGLASLLERNSSMPKMMAYLSNMVQYYTIINAGSLQEITEAAFPLLQETVDINSLWNTADKFSKNFFDATLHDLLFSWTGKECSVIGLEGFNAPVFVLQITDEARRREIFDNVLSSVILQDDTSLILNGVRLPRIYLPPFLQNLLKAFGINMPSPYYLVHDGFVYFSESPEVLSSVYTSSVGGSRISANHNWQAVSKEQSLEFMFSLFYDLERSEPFFVRGNNILSRILELYAIGRCDASVRDSMLSLQLTVASRQSKQSRSIPGFPVQLEGNAEQLHVESADKPTHIFWVEGTNKIKVMDITTTQTKHIEMPSSVSIATAKEKTPSGGVLWVVTEEGAVHCLTAELENTAGFPLLLNAKPTSLPSSKADSLVIPLADKSICTVQADGSTYFFPLDDVSGTILAAPGTLDDKMTFYDKGFLGKVFVMGSSPVASYDVIGIAYGSPALLSKGGVLYTAFITQSGHLYIWRKQGETNLAPIELDINGIFFSNVVSNGNFFFALSSNGILHRISLDGEHNAVQIPNATAKEGVLSTKNLDIYAAIDGNLIYGFNENLELLHGFPLTGTGMPVFADANGDGNADCFTITLDNKLNAWNLR